MRCLAECISTWSQMIKKLATRICTIFKGRLFLPRDLTVDKIFLKKKLLAQCAWTKPCSWHLIFETSESWLIKWQVAMPWAPTKKSQIFLLSSQASTFTNDSAVILASPPWATPLVKISYWPKDRSKYKRSNDSEIVRCTQTLTRLWLEWLWNVVGNTKQKHHFGSLQNTTQH